jgi:hypothetical protein
VARLAAVCLSISYPTLASAPHSVINGFKNLLAIAAATDVEFKEAQTIKEFLKVCISLTLLLMHTVFFICPCIVCCKYHEQLLPHGRLDIGSATETVALIWKTQTFKWVS